jgi:phosphoribosylformimino-5-aminoimidazole carboxamide ribotide isomerase
MPTRFVILPAIDILAGHAVRLRQGDPARTTRVGDDPVAVARRWHAEGAEWLHVVDLDGALQGAPKQLDMVARICAAVRIPVQVGGGLRSMDDLRAALGAGCARVIVGTAALQSDLVSAAVREFGDRLVVALDARDGVVAVEGWQRTSAASVLDVARRLADAGVARFVYTDIPSDGMLGGPNLDGLRRLVAAVPVQVIASGGVASIDDLRAVRDIGAEGAVVGRALYDGRLHLPDALAAGGRGVPCSPNA